MQYTLNQDPNPVIIRKKSAQPVKYTQHVTVKFLQPPTPQPAGDIVITQQKDRQAPPPPPKHIRQQPPPPAKPAPLIVRERPPQPPAPIAPEHHVIPGRVVAPPPRKVITERLPQLPQPPQDIFVERWLEYPQRSRRVVFHAAPKIVPAPAPKNVVIQWDSPAVTLNRQFRNLGTSHADPAQYAAQFGASLVDSAAIPAVARNVRPANGAVLAAESTPKPVKFVGDLAALKLLNRAAPTHHHRLAQPVAFTQQAISLAQPMGGSDYAEEEISDEVVASDGLLPIYASTVVSDTDYDYDQVQASSDSASGLVMESAFNSDDELAAVASGSYY